MKKYNKKIIKYYIIFKIEDENLSKYHFYTFLFGKFSWNYLISSSYGCLGCNLWGPLKTTGLSLAWAGVIGIYSFLNAPVAYDLGEGMGFS